MSFWFVFVYVRLINNQWRENKKKKTLQPAIFLSSLFFCCAEYDCIQCLFLTEISNSQQVLGLPIPCIWILRLRTYCSFSKCCWWLMPTANHHQYFQYQFLYHLSAKITAIKLSEWKTFIQKKKKKKKKKATINRGDFKFYKC